ncbi:MAG: hypothetical protein ACPGO3_02375 [Magnetospiraceae bacterium]
MRLKPCPKCQSPRTRLEIAKGGDMRGECLDCGHQGQPGWPVEVAVEAWNAETPVSAPDGDEADGA